MMKRVGKLQTALFGMVLLGTVAACGDDNGDNGGGNRGGDASGGGDVAASHLAFDGEALDLDSVRCEVVGVEGGMLRVIADGVDSAGSSYRLTAEEELEGAMLRLVRGAGDPDFSGYEWYSRSAEVGLTEIDDDGARGTLELEWSDYSGGHDETADGGPVDIDFDLVC